MKRATLVVVFCFACFYVWPVLGEFSGWVRSETCWVTERPSYQAEVVGIILKKAAVTVEGAEEGWLRIVFAPVRDPVTGKFINCAGCYIRESDVSTTLPR